MIVLLAQFDWISQDKRSFFASIVSGVTLGEAEFDAWLRFQAGKDSVMTIEVGLRGQERPVSLSDVLYLFHLGMSIFRIFLGSPFLNLWF